MTIGAALQKYLRGGILFVGLVVARLVAIDHAQSNTHGGSECDLLRGEQGDLGRFVLNTTTQNVLEHNVQILLNCIPAHGVVEFAVDVIPLGAVLEITAPITIEGNGASVQCLNASKKGSIKIRSDNVTISNLTFEGCGFNSSVGLVNIRNSKNVTLREIQFVENKNIAGPGCISADRSEIKLLRMEAKKNNGSFGGVLFAKRESKITIADSRFSENGALDKGGAVYLLDSNATIIDSSFENNKATDLGGAICGEDVLDYKVFLENLTFSGNKALRDHENGENRGSGGAVALVGPKLRADIRTTVFIKNFALVNGGGLAIGSGKAVSVLDSYFMGNSAALGGALSALASLPNVTNLEVRGTIFEGNSAKGSGALFGGAIGLSRNGTSTTLDNVTFSENVVEFHGGEHGGGGAIYALDIKSIKISGAIFNRNQKIDVQAGDGKGKSLQIEAPQSGKNFAGGALLISAVLEISIESSTFLDNQAHAGGAVEIIAREEKRSSASFADCSFGGNSAIGDPIQAMGGALCLVGDRLEAAIKSSTFRKNRAGNSGGAIIGISIHRLEISHSSFIQNKAVKSDERRIVDSLKGSGILTVDGDQEIVPNGGAINLGDVSKITIINSSFVHNEATHGGGVYVQTNQTSTTDNGSIRYRTNSSLLRIESSVLRSNKASFFGGAVHLMGDGTEVWIENSKLENNTSEDCILFIKGSSFRGNVAMNNGGGLDLTSTNATISKSNFTGNIGHGAGGAIHSGHKKKSDAQRKPFVKTRDVVFEHNSAANNGGALRLLGVDLDLEGGQCRNNSARMSGGAINLDQFEGSSPNATIKAANFTANEAGLGGGVFLQNGNLSLSHCAFQANLARHGGGALFCEDLSLNWVVANKDSVATVHSSNFSGNEAGEKMKDYYYAGVESIDGKGGAVVMSGLGLVSEVKDCNFSKNTAGSGGAVYVQDVKKMNVEKSNFWMGAALTGGALKIISASDSFAAKNVTFVGNAARWGGAVSLSQFDSVRFDAFPEEAASFEQAQFLDNFAVEGGGAIDMKARSLECAHCVFDSNSAGFGGEELGSGGAARALPTSNLTLVNSSITNCTATQSGGGIFLEDAMFHGENVTILNNAAVKNGGGFAMHFATFSSIQLVPWRCRSCSIQGNRATRGGGVHVSADKTMQPDCQASEPTFLGKNQHQRLTFSAECERSLGESRVLLDSAIFEGNMAEGSGSDIFLSRFKNNVCCDDQCWSVESAMNEGVQKCGLDRMSPRTGNNSAPLGTLFESVSISPFLATDQASGEELPAINVTTLDSFGQIAAESMNLKIRAVTPGGELFGNPVTSEGVLMKGEINVTGIFMRALPGDYNLSFEVTSEDGTRVLAAPMQVEIRECVIGEVSREGGLRCDRCPDDFFSLDVTDDNCTPCPKKEAKCSGGKLVPLEGFWHSHPRTSQVHACLTEEACTYQNRTNILFASNFNSSGGYPQCAKGYEGLLCGSCDTSHGKSRFQCSKCQEKVPAGVGIGVVMLALAILSLIYVRSATTYSQELLGTQSRMNNQSIAQSATQGGFNSQGLIPVRTKTQHGQRYQNVDQRKTRGSDVFKILVNFFQVTGSAAAINVGWTESMLTLFTSWDMISGVADSNNFFAFECAFSSGKNGLPRSIKASIVLAVSPFIVWAALVIVHSAHALKNKKAIQYVKLWSYIAFLAVQQASYISVTRAFVRIFYCARASPVEGLFWVQDTSVGCYKGSHAFLVGFIGAPGLLLISIGFPGWLLFKLTRATESLEEEEVVSRYGFLYRAYRRNVAAWEVVILVRKALLATIVVFGRTLGEGIQISLALFIMIVSIILQMHFQPFLESKLNGMELASLAISTLAYLVGDLVTKPKMTNGGVVAMTVIFMGAAGSFVAYMFKQIFDMVFLELREWMNKEYPGSQLPTSKHGLVKKIIENRVKKMKVVLDEKKTIFVKKVSSFFSSTA